MEGLAIWLRNKLREVVPSEKWKEMDELLLTFYAYVFRKDVPHECVPVSALPYTLSTVPYGVSYSDYVKSIDFIIKKLHEREALEYKEIEDMLVDELGLSEDETESIVGKLMLYEQIGALKLGSSGAWLKEMLPKVEVIADRGDLLVARLTCIDGLTVTYHISPIETREEDYDD